MNDRRSPEHLLSAWFETEAPATAPDALRSDIYRATSSVRPRPAWLARLRGNAMDVIAGGAGRRDSRLIPVLALVLVLLALIAGAVYVGSQPPSNPIAVVPSGSPTAPPTPFATPVADASTELPHPIVQVVRGDDAMWVSVAGDDTGERARSIYRIDPATNAATLVVDDLPVGAADVVTFVERNGSIWAAHDPGNRLLQFDSSTGELLGEIPVGAGPIEPAVAFGDAWSLNYDDGSLTRVDTTDGSVVATIEIPAFAGQGPRAVAEDMAVVWAVAPRADRIVAISSTMNAIITEVPLSPGMRCGIGVAARKTWVSACDGGSTVDVISEGIGYQLETIDVASGVGPPLFESNGRVWLPAADASGSGVMSLVAVDSDSLDVGATVNLGRVASPVTGFGSIWYSSGADLHRLSLDAFGGG